MHYVTLIYSTNRIYLLSSIVFYIWTYSYGKNMYRTRQLKLKFSLYWKVVEESNYISGFWYWLVFDLEQISLIKGSNL